MGAVRSHSFLFHQHLSPFVKLFYLKTHTPKNKTECDSLHMSVIIVKSDEALMSLTVFPSALLCVYLQFCPLAVLSVDNLRNKSLK